MSITITTDVFCDDCGMDWVHGITGNKPQRAEARRVARAAGWLCDRSGDYCPKCRPSDKAR